MVDPLDDWDDDQEEDDRPARDIRSLIFGGLLRKLTRMGSSAATPAMPTLVEKSTGGSKGDGAGLKDIARYLTTGEVAQVRRALEARRRRRANAAR